MARRISGGGESRRGEGGAMELERYPSSAVGSYRSASLQQDQPEKSLWGNVKKSLVNNTLVAVGLRPTREEGRHWDAIKGIMLNNKQSSGAAAQQEPSVLIQASHRPKDTPLVRHLSGRDFSSTLARVETDGAPVSPSFVGRPVSIPAREMSVNKVDKTTGRSQVLPLDQLKPDLWKLAFNSVRASSRFKKPPTQEDAIPQAAKKSSFDFVDEDGEEEVYDGFPVGVYRSPLSPPPFSPIKEEVEEDNFFGFDAGARVDADGTDEVDSAAVTKRPVSVRRERIKKVWDKVTLGGGYVGGAGGLGTITKLLHFKYKNMSPEQQRLLDSKLLHKRPYFTYWLMTVHVIIMIVALALYGFAPYGWDLIEERASVRQTDLSFAATSRLVVPSVWFGPPQQSLVLLGALFAPCMRRDGQIFEAIESDRETERDMSGCCVRRDRSGCFQATTCQPRFSDFYFEVNSARAVCGTSPDTCTDPAPGASRGDVLWNRTDILTWPICRNSTNATAPHLTCEITSRPCCHGIQANCIITTREQCDYLAGRFHQEAFLCSQVDCLNDICGLLPFREFNQPDQIYRLYIALFLHAGLLHLFLSLLFSFFVLRYIEKRLGWVRTTVLYILSGIGGNLVSAYFAPYNPEVGPAGSILGVVAYFFVFLVFESPLLVKPWQEALKLLAVCVFLFLLGLLPFIDNYAHIGGFVFGFLISGILVPYGNFKEVWKLVDHRNDESYSKKYLVVKWVMVVGGLVALSLLFTLFFILFYVVQSTWVGFSYLTCIPFTSTLCVDQQVLIRDRDQVIV